MICARCGKTKILFVNVEDTAHIARKNKAAKCFLLWCRPKRMNYVVRMLAMTDCSYSPVHGFTVVVALQY